MIDAMKLGQLCGKLVSLGLRPQDIENIILGGEETWKTKRSN